MELDYLWEDGGHDVISR